MSGASLMISTHTAARRPTPTQPARSAEQAAVPRWSLLALIFLSLCLVTPSASAGSKRSSSKGALGRATGAVRQAQQNHRRSQSAPDNRDNDRDNDRNNDRDDSRDYHRDDSHDDREDDSFNYSSRNNTNCFTCSLSFLGSERAERPSVYQPVMLPDIELSLALDVQSVVDSDGSFAGGVGLRIGRIGVDLAGRHYFESVMTQDGTESVHMNVWHLTGAAHITGSARTRVWLHGGVAGVSSSAFDSELGATVGASINHQMSPSLKFTTDARYYWLADYLRASEAQVAVEVSILRLGYRAFLFSVGPPLHGPEAGMRLRF